MLSRTMLSNAMLEILWYCIIVVSPKETKKEKVELDEWGQFVEFD